MSDDAIKTSIQNGAIAKPAGSRSTSRASGARLRFALYAVGALAVMLFVAYIDGGEEPLHPIVQSISMSSHAEQGQ